MANLSKDNRITCDIGESGSPTCVVRNRRLSQHCRMERPAGYGIIAPRRKSIAHLHRPRRASYQKKCNILRIQLINAHFATKDWEVAVSRLDFNRVARAAAASSSLSS
jgi:hypothetical protein